jgi:glycosyltransferase involved in cell wall biosynthesis
MIARALRRAGHEVVFLVASRERLNRPEHRYADISVPYPPWIVDLSSALRWHCLVPGPSRSRVLAELNSCDAVVLNEEGPALAAGLNVPYVVLLTGSDVEIFANPSKVQSLKPQAIDHPAWLRRTIAGLLPDRLILNRLITPQRAGLKGARAVFFLPRGLAPAADTILNEIGVAPPRRRESFFTDTELATFSPPPHRSPLRVVSATRLTWLPNQAAGLSTLDLKGSDIMIRGLAEYCTRNNAKLDIHLVRKGRQVSEAAQLVKEVGLDGHVTWHDEMNQQAVLEFFREADIVIEQLAQSAVGMAGLDAMATGRPVIANGRPEIIERIAPEASPILQATTPQQVAAHLAALAVSTSLREDVGRRSRAYVERNFSAEVAAKSFLSALSSTQAPCGSFAS